LEVEDLHTSPVPPKIMNTLRHTKSEENLAAEVAAQAESASLCAFSVYGNPDEETGDCWSQEDDEISQQVGLFTLTFPYPSYSQPCSYQLHFNFHKN